MNLSKSLTKKIGLAVQYVTNMEFLQKAEDEMWFTEDCIYEHVVSIPLKVCMDIYNRYQNEHYYNQEAQRKISKVIIYKRNIMLFLERYGKLKSMYIAGGQVRFTIKVNGRYQEFKYYSRSLNAPKDFLIIERLLNG